MGTAAAAEYSDSLLPQVWGSSAGHGHTTDPCHGLHHLSIVSAPQTVGKCQISPPRLVLLSHLLSHRYFCHIIIISGERKRTRPKETISGLTRTYKVESSYRPSNKRSSDFPPESH